MRSVEISYVVVRLGAASRSGSGVIRFVPVRLGSVWRSGYRKLCSGAARPGVAGQGGPGPAG